MAAQTPDSVQKPSFRVIIAGGSIGGLTLAHCLSRAGIDYVVLEARSEIAPQIGAAIGISPNGGRILDQLELFDVINAQTCPMKFVHSRESDGTRFSSSDIFQSIQKRFGYPCIFPARQAVLQVLADNLKEKDRIHLNQRIVKIEHLDNGVTVYTKDGSEYTGDLVVGADGVHSTVRSEMWRHADLLKPGLITPEEKTGMVAEYKCLFGLSSPTPGLREGHAELTLNNGFSVLCMAEKGGRVFWFVTQKMEKKYTWPDVPRFTKDDAEKYAHTLKNTKLLETTTFGDLWENRTTFHLTALDENVFEHWHFGRIVCLGDSVHKMTPNLGQGGNCAIESAAVLANNLHKLVNEHKNHKPTTEELNAYLDSFQKSHKDRILVIYAVSAIVTRSQARDGLLHKIMSQYVYKIIDDNAFNLNSDMLVAAAKVDYLPLPERSINGWMPFDKNLGILKKPQSSRRMLQASPFLVFFGVAITVISTAEFLNGTRELLRQASVAGKWVAEDGRVLAIEDIYLGVPWVDALVKQFVIRFPAYLFRSRSSHVQRLQMISTVGDLIPIHTIWTIEAWRSGNLQTLTNLSMLLALAYQIFGFGVVAPLYFFYHYVQTSYHNYASIDMRVVQPKHAWTLIPTVIVAMILPAVLLFGPFNFSPDTYQIITATWQFFPLSFALLHRALAKLVPETEQEKSTPGVDIPILQRTYTFVALVSASAHLYVRSFRFLEYEMFFAGARDPFSVVGSAAEGLGKSASFSYLLGFGSSLLWVAMTINDLKKAGRTDASWVKIVTSLVAGTAIFGPGAVVAVFWMWREDILSKRRTGRDTVNPL